MSRPRWEVLFSDLGDEVDSLVWEPEEWFGFNDALRSQLCLEHWLSEISDPRERRIVVAFSHGLTQAEIAAQEGLSQQRISQIRQALLVKLAETAPLYEGSYYRQAFLWYDQEQRRAIYRPPKRVWKHRGGGGVMPRERRDRGSRFLIFVNLLPGFWDEPVESG